MDFPFFPADVLFCYDCCWIVVCLFLISWDFFVLLQLCCFGCLFLLIMCCCCCHQISAHETYELCFVNHTLISFLSQQVKRTWLFFSLHCVESRYCAVMHISDRMRKKILVLESLEPRTLDH